MSSTTRLTAILAAAAALVATTTGTATAAQAQTGTPSQTATGPTWHQVPPPVPSGNILAMTQVDKHTTWATGFQATWHGEASTLNPVLLAYDDRTGHTDAAGHAAKPAWTRIPTPADTSDSRINALSADGAHNVWLVGDNNPVGPGTILTEHWDGKSWHIADAPVPDGTLSAGFLGVATVGPRDAWAVGWTQRMRGDTSFDTGLVEHWDGKAWTQVKLPADVPDAMLLGITATGPRDVWAAGVLTDGTDQPALLHYDGRTWTRATVSDTGLYAEFNTVVAAAPNDVWAAGRSVTSDKDRGHPLVAHYDGHSWKTVPAPGTGVIFAAAPTPGGVTVVGYDKNTGQSYGEQLDGQGWHSLNLPTVGIDSTPYSLAVSSRSLIVGGAYNPDETNPFQPLLLTADR
ncbi:hypothetical protein GCM10009839_41760 [Catenulispora yoronensis]|uniref:Uncharacterized protein n=1 Tax=Catenulispora yoronensis TaxID=450799 RepID=A0ABP5G0E9_9ACTN